MGTSSATARVSSQRMRVIGMAALTVVLAGVPLRRAFAYVDPNTAGALYQMLFPLLIAIGSAIAALRRRIGLAFRKVTVMVVAALRGGRAQGITTARRGNRRAE